MSVTAVPLRPLGKGTIVKFWIGLLLIVLLGVGLAWIGTSRQQFVTTDEGIRYRTFESGEGDPLTPADIAMTELELRGPKGNLIQSSREAGAPAPLTSENAPPWLTPLVGQMRKGGAYQLFVPASVLLEGQPAPPGFPLKTDEMAEIRVKVLDIQRDGVAQQRLQQQMMQQMQQQMMQQQMEGGGAPGPGGAPGGGGPGGGAPGGGGPGGAGGPGGMAPPPAGPGGR
jgi:FKBP-type peptidyl-prolyl cis-trans isomerase FkpA